jgi:hypothetical protein
MATQSEKEALAGKYGMNMSDLEALLEANPELADSLSRSFGASLMPGLDVPRGQSVGPYGAYVASSPLSRLAQGGMEGYKVGAQQAGQKALLDALRGGGPAAGSVMESPQAGGAMGDNDAQMGGGMFGDTTEDPMAPQPVPDMMGGAQATGVPTPPPSPTLQNPPAGAQPIPPAMGTAPGEIPSWGSVPQQSKPADMFDWETMEDYQRRKRAQRVDTGVAP